MPTSQTVVCLLCGLVGFSAPGTGREPTLELQLRETRLELEASLDHESGRLEGRATLTVENLSEHPASEVPLLLGRLMTLDRATSADRRPLEIDQDIISFADFPELQVNHGRVRLPTALAPGERATFSVDYSGWVVPYTETGMLYVRDRIDEAFSILRADAFSFPVVGVPSDEANSMIPSTDFDYRVAIEVPERFTVANGGRLVGKTVADGRATWVYESTGPVPFLLVAVAQYALLEERGVRVFSFQEDVDGAARVLEGTLGAMDLLEEWFGPLSGPAELAVMEIPDDWGSQANLRAGIIQAASAFRQPERLVEVYHELSHLWNAPASELRPARWNEGLANFLQFRLAEVLDGWEGMEESVDRRAARLLQAIEETPAYQNVPFPSYGERRMTDLSYGTGLVMFYLLDEIMGTESLYEALRAHYQSHKGSGGSFEDLVVDLKEASPVSLDLFLQDWVASARWQEKLASAGSVAALLASYRETDVEARRPRTIQQPPSTRVPS